MRLKKVPFFSSSNQCEFVCHLKISSRYWLPRIQFPWSGARYGFYSTLLQACEKQAVVSGSWCWIDRSSPWWVCWCTASCLGNPDCGTKTQTNTPWVAVPQTLISQLNYFIICTQTCLPTPAWLYVCVYVCVCVVLTVPAVLWPVACCIGLSEVSSLSSAVLLFSPPPPLLSTASRAGAPTLLS